MPGNWKDYRDWKQKQTAATKRIDESLTDYNEDDDVSDLTEWYKEYIDSDDT